MNHFSPGDQINCMVWAQLEWVGGMNIWFFYVHYKLLLPFNCFKGEVQDFLHKPNNTDIDNHLHCSSILLQWTAQSWEPELIAAITASWKLLKQTMEVHRHSANSSKNIIKNILILTDEKLTEWSVLSADVLTLKHKVEQWHMTQKQVFVCFLKQSHCQDIYSVV